MHKTKTRVKSYLPWIPVFNFLCSEWEILLPPRLTQNIAKYYLTLSAAEGNGFLL